MQRSTPQSQKILFPPWIALVSQVAGTKLPLLGKNHVRILVSCKLCEPRDRLSAGSCVNCFEAVAKLSFGSAVDVTSGQSAKTQDSNADVSGTSKPVGKVDGPRADTRSSGAGMLPSIGVQGMRVLSSLKVAGWNLAGGGGARSAHVVKEDKDLHHKEVAGAPVRCSLCVVVWATCVGNDDHACLANFWCCAHDEDFAKDFFISRLLEFLMVLTCLSRDRC